MTFVFTANTAAGKSLCFDGVALITLMAVQKVLFNPKLGPIL